MPKIEHRFDDATLAREGRVQKHIVDVFEDPARTRQGVAANATTPCHIPGGSLP